jgi:hypothetical protein
VATAEQLWSGMVSQIQSALSTSGLNAKLGIDWPPKDALDLVSQGNSSPVISVFDCGGIKNQTRNVLLIPVQPPNLGTPGGILTTTTTQVGENGSLVLNGSGLVLTFDCFFLALDLPNSTLFAEYITTNSDTLTTAMTALTAQINDISGLTAVYDSGAQTITVSLSDDIGGPFNVRTGVVNVGGYVQEVERINRQLQITTWTNNTADRATYGTCLENLFANLEVNTGFILADNSWCRVMVRNDKILKDLQFNNLYRRDFFLDCEYPLTQNIPAWVVEDIIDTYSPES